MKTNRVFLLLGSNEGERLEILQQASLQLAKRLATSDLICSAIYETAAWGKEDQAPFLNAALAFDTHHSLEALHQTTQEVEHAFGRERRERWGQRTLDIDILFYGDVVVRTPLLQVPHLGIPDRRFALVPLVEIAADWRHPISRKTMTTLLAECPDPLGVQQTKDKLCLMAIR